MSDVFAFSPRVTKKKKKQRCYYESYSQAIIIICAQHGVNSWISVELLQEWNQCLQGINQLFNTGNGLRVTLCRTLSLSFFIKISLTVIIRSGFVQGSVFPFITPRNRIRVSHSRGDILDLVLVWFEQRADRLYLSQTKPSNDTKIVLSGWQTKLQRPNHTVLKLLTKSNKENRMLREQDTDVG